MENQHWEIFHDYLDSYSLRDMNRLLEIFSDDFSGFGTGSDENSFDFEDFTELYIREVEQVPSKLDIQINREKIHSHSSNFFTGMAELDIKVSLDDGILSFEGLRISVIFQKKKNLWKLVHKHISSPLIIQENGETVPIKELQKKNQELELKVEEKTKKLLIQNVELQEKNDRLQAALNEVSTLKTLLPICANCKKIRDDSGYWQNVEEYLQKNTDIRLTHSLCNDCVQELYPEMNFDNT
ncbi:nuclear transport factor 2 family protein [Candidatus Lokiarchaeum ossiferum]